MVFDVGGCGDCDLSELTKKIRIESNKECSFVRSQFGCRCGKMAKAANKGSGS